jgi:hypothetical protein
MLQEGGLYLKNISIRRLISFAAFGLFCCSIAVTGAEDNPALPFAHMIANVPWHQQQNALFCGEGDLEIVYDYLGPDIDQKEIADVARSSSSGTWTYDMVRSGQFSYLSAAQGRFFPNSVPRAGYPERQLGYAAFSYSSDTFWFPELKSLVAADIPVIVLMTFEPTGGIGHYRVAIGYNDTEEAIYFSDPWGRDEKHKTNRTGITRWTYDEFQNGWNYSAAGEGHPYFGMVILPWKVNVAANGKLTLGSTISITAKVTYPCPNPFNGSLFPARNCRANITLPHGMRLLSGSSNIALDDIKAGSTATCSWKARIDGPVSGKSINVEAKGLVSGHVSEARWTGESVNYPPYNYTDAIGGNGSIALWFNNFFIFSFRQLRIYSDSQGTAYLARMSQLRDYFLVFYRRKNLN